MRLIGALCAEAPVAPVIDVVLLAGRTDSVTCDDRGFDETRDTVLSLGGVVVVELLSSSPGVTVLPSSPVVIVLPSRPLLMELTVERESVVVEGAQSVGVPLLL